MRLAAVRAHWRLDKSTRLYLLNGARAQDLLAIRVLDVLELGAILGRLLAQTLLQGLCRVKIRMLEVRQTFSIGDITRF